MSFEIIKKRLDEYITLQTTLKNSPEKIVRHEVVTVYLGDDYFVELKPDQAISFLERRINVLQNEVDTVKHLSGINEEGLPIMDIFEELDDDDNVINSRVDRAASAFEHLQKAMSGPQPDETPQLATKKVEEPREPKSEEPRIKEITEPKEQTFNGISKEDLLELHLVQDELDFDDEDDMDIDLDELEIDDDDDSDEDTEPLHGSLFPQTQKVRQLLTKQFPGLDEDRKAVRFAESLVVREFETSPDERKGLIIDEVHEVPAKPEEPVQEEPKRRGVSQFKLRRGNNSPTSSVAKSPRVATEAVEGSVSGRPADDPVSNVVKRPVSEVVEGPVSNVVERPVSDVMERPVFDVMERPVFDVVENPTPKRAVSDVVERPVSQSKKPNESASKSPKPKLTYSRRYKIPESRPAAVSLSAPKTPQPDPAYEGLGYIRDEDTALRKELEEEALHLFDQSTIPDEDFLALHDNALEDELDQLKDEKPILSAVTERDDSEPAGVDEIEKLNDMREIRLQYQRLRQRLVHKAGGYGKTEKDMEVEAIDEEGNPQKVSRFKAARIGMR
ncbi:hypothetical protein B9G98_01838 [Wickerhamiella sorbophila]|uniref:DUF3835 domain-containing protein n=1 Tax=Wickerhamiella sorbophila TaxID=45607 RepID=A0A2T0FGU5_9ASCO|nr:hypothetical protein B9G98_01838 [Wickerhamiella sorbophila]PRT54218.1 hypothetical protein B9G98_01838 [Wickerhamiella sorbophila]